MSKLLKSQLEFLSNHNIPLDKVFDATGLRKSEYHEIMSQASLWVAYGVTPCKKAGHTLRTRTGHCVQCRPSNLSYLQRHDIPNELYIAYSSSKRLIKIGIGESAQYRIELLNSERYATAGDWSLKYKLSVERAGAIEAAVHADLSAYAFKTEYWKEGKLVTTREVFKVSLAKAIESVNRLAVRQS